MVLWYLNHPRSLRTRRLRAAGAANKRLLWYLDYNQLLRGCCDRLWISNHCSSNARYSGYLVLQLLFSEDELHSRWQDLPTVSETADFRLFAGKVDDVLPTPQVPCERLACNARRGRIYPNAGS